MNLIVKGFIIGLAKIVPGVSGSLVALNLGVYEKGLKAIINFFSNVKYNTYFLLNVGIGIILAIVFGSNIIIFLLNKYYFMTMLIFIGLLIGSNISLLKDTKSNKEFIIMLSTFTLMLFLFFIKNENNYIYHNTIFNNLYVVLLGFIDAATMIIPAISGTAIFMLLGSYNFFLSIFINAFNNINIITLFLIGLLIGIILISKLMSELLERKKEIIYPMINGFFLSSVLFLVIETYKNTNVIQILLSVPIIILFLKIGSLCNK